MRTLNPRPREVLPLLAALLAALGVLAILWPTSPDTSTPTQARPTVSAPSQSSSDEAAQPTPTRRATPTNPTPAQASPAEIAALAIKAYTEYSYRDRGPTDWINRLAPLATPSLIRNLRHTFRQEQGGRDQWNSVIRTPGRATHTTVVGVHRSGLHTNSRISVTYVVTYETAVQTRQTKTWTRPTEPLGQFVTLVRVPGGWKVAHIVPTDDRSAA